MFTATVAPSNQIHAAIVRCTRMGDEEVGRFVGMLNAFLGTDGLIMEDCLDEAAAQGYVVTVGEFGQPIIRQVVTRIY